ncbi:hypothetical protein CBR_g16801 [Chara braunii]|uniref:Uncharacterized protein n=1 Tax=Chara braunii TaxID=69332 RepID=A0A388KTU2_CHABU|nr:hypothetical protein CBR_g16801 [Chara braunii]|eukprot:GBG73459.1 hypothetical protein CBR_g16801 [Chara braunii]
MSVVGIDVGNLNCTVAVARHRGIDVVLNEESKRETPALVAFGDHQRLIGAAGMSSLSMNPKNTIVQIKRIVGRNHGDPELETDLKTFPFKTIPGPNGEPLLQVVFKGEPRTYTPVQVLAMLLSNLKSIAETNLGIPVLDCVIGVPTYFTQSQRLAYLDAAAICGLKPLRLMHELTAAALSYGIYKTDLSDTEPTNVAIVDVGHSSLQVCVVALKKGQVKVLAQGFDRTIGGRDFDEVLFDYFAEQFKGTYKIDVKTNARAAQRLRIACEKIKKILSANPEALMSIECLMDEKDVKCFIKRDQFEALCEPLLKKVLGPLERTIKDFGVAVESLAAVELIGSGSRIPAIGKILTNFFGREPRRTMNASECIARGCALQCAMLSPTFKVRQFEVLDAYPFAIDLVWSKGPQSDAAAPAEEEEPKTKEPIFPKGCTFPAMKQLTFNRSEPFTIDAVYADINDLPAGTPKKFASFQIGPFTPTKPGEKVKLKVKVKLDVHGILKVESATMIETEEGADGKEESQADGAVPMEGDAKRQEGEAKDEGGDSKMDDSETRSSAGNGGVSVESVKKEVKKKLKKTEVPVTAIILGSLAKEDLERAMQLEYSLQLDDRVMEETKERKNAVESYVYEMRNKLSEKLAPYAAAEEKETLLRLLNDTEDWLYDEGENQMKGVYNAKLEELKKLGDPIEFRQKEDEARPNALRQLDYCFRSFRDAAMSENHAYDHIDDADKEKVVKECNDAEAWLREKYEMQKNLPKTADPVLLCSEIMKKAEVLNGFCKPIMLKPKPKAPSPAPEKKPEAKGPASPENTHTAEEGSEDMETDTKAEGGPEEMQSES